jgi:membrane protease subunit (stomatin/prohibitin family)
MDGIGILLTSIIVGCIFGAITKSMYSNRGHEGGFWTGFFLGVIGIIIAATKSDIKSQETYESIQYQRSRGWNCLKCGSYNGEDQTFCHNCHEYRHTDTQKPTGVTSTKITETLNWQCASCGTSNDMANKFCPQCGSKYAGKWKCAQCETVNKENAKFCTVCGSAKGDSKEVDTSRKLSVKESTTMLWEAQALKTAAQIADFVKKTLGTDAKGAASLMSKLEALVLDEKLEGTRKSEALSCIESYLKANGGADGETGNTYAIDRTQDYINCPGCGFNQRSNRNLCFHCSAKFIG